MPIEDVASRMNVCGSVGDLVAIVLCTRLRLENGNARAPQSEEYQRYVVETVMDGVAERG